MELKVPFMVPWDDIKGYTPTLSTTTREKLIAYLKLLSS